MPFVVRSDSENEAELVFLSPEEEPPKPQDRGQTGDQGASPALRRSNRKRKSVTAYSESDMSKGSGSKKKKNSPSKKMPKVTRTPAKDDQPPQRQPPQDEAAPEKKKEGPDIEGFLTGMEARLSSQIEITNKAVNHAISLAKMANDSLGALEDKVDENEARLTKALEAVEDRMMGKMQEAVKGMVMEQLRAAGFDPDLSAGALTTFRRSSVADAENTTHSPSSYAVSYTHLTLPTTPYV